MLRRFLTSAAAFAVIASSAAGPAHAAYPERTITVVCASGAGGAVDVTTRIITDHMAKTLGQNIIIQNEAGAGGTLAMNQTMKAQPDGYTLLTIGPAVSTIKELFPNATVDPVRDLQPVTIIGQTPMVLVTHKDVPGNDYKSLLAYIKAHPGELTFASNGRGSAGHLAGSLFKKMADANIRYLVAGPAREVSVLPGEMVALVREMCEQVYRHDWTTPQWTERIPDTRHRLAEITTPALVVIGTSDAPGLVELSAHLAESLPQAELVELAGTGHLPSMERPDEVNALLRKVL